MKEIEYLVLGAGLSGLSVSYHLGHERCLLLEKQAHAFGLISSETKDGFTWDIGPHVSFTKSDYVRDLFSRSVGGAFNEYKVTVGNYFYGSWIGHPVQANLYQVPESIRAECVDSFLHAANRKNTNIPNNYQEWLDRSLGEVITKQFVAPYTRKYWTTDPKNLGVDWIGNRIFKPKVDDVVNGAKREPKKSAHYISRVRYPKTGGYQAYATDLLKDANILVDSEVTRIDPKNKCVVCANGERFHYGKLISTIPLSEFVPKVEGVSRAVIEAASELVCSQLLLVNIEVQHPVQRPEHWLYVYDENKYSTRITFTEKMSSANAPKNKSGIQVEVYFSKYRPYQGNAEEIGQIVMSELLEMGLIESKQDLERSVYSLKWIPYANIIFDHNRKRAMSVIMEELESIGLARREDEFDATTDWNNPGSLDVNSNIFLLGRFGEWKYYWSDDAVLCGKYLAEMLSYKD